MEEFFIAVLQRYGWIAWIFIGLGLFLIFVAFAQGREIDLKFLRIGPTSSVSPSNSPQTPPIQQTFHLTPQQLSDEQYEEISIRVSARIRAEQQTLEKSQVPGEPAAKQEYSKLEFAPLDLPDRVVQLLKIRHTIEVKIREVFSRQEHFMMMGVAPTSRYLEYGAMGVFPPSFFDAMQGLDWEMNQIIYAGVLDDEQFERAQVVASEVMRQLEDIASRAISNRK